MLAGAPPPLAVCGADQLQREGLAGHAVAYVGVLAWLQRHPVDGVLPVC